MCCCCTIFQYQLSKIATPYFELFLQANAANTVLYLAMVLDYKNFSLYNKVIFEKVRMKPPFHPPSNFPNEACFVYVTEGGQLTYAATGRHILKKNDAVLLKCGQYFTEWLKQDEYEECEAIGVHLYPEVLKRIYENDLPDFVLKDNQNGNQLVVVANNHLIDAYIKSLEFYFNNPSLADDELIKLKLKEIILLLTKTEKAASVIEIISGLFSPRAFKLKDVVETHLYSDLNLDQLAAFCNMSLSTFKREFEKTFKASPARYFKLKKLEKSCGLLKLGHLPVTDIAYECGFADVSHFSNSFKEVYHISPSAYRLNQK
jgi:AraC family transcriptional regulator, exoenzyme S synthesis regulatory protein ExsA